MVGPAEGDAEGDGEAPLDFGDEGAEVVIVLLSELSVGNGLGVVESEVSLGSDEVLGDWRAVGDEGVFEFSVSAIGGLLLVEVFSVWPEEEADGAGYVSTVPFAESSLLEIVPFAFGTVGAVETFWSLVEMDSGEVEGI